MPAACAAASARATCRADVDRRRERHRLLSMHRPQRPPVDELLHDEGSPAGVSPTSWMVTMFGWLSADAARASRRKRWTGVGSVAGAARMTLSATGRLSRVSNAAKHLAHAATADASVDAVVPERSR